MHRTFSSYLLFLSIAALIIVLYLGDFAGLQKMQWKIDDMMYSFRGEKKPATEVVLINIDDLSVKALGDWPWSSERLADLIAVCNSAHPKAMLVNLDLSTFAPEDTFNGAQILANQISWADNIVLTYDITPAEYSNQRMSRPEYLFRNALQTDSDLGILDDHQTLNIHKPFLPQPTLCQYSAGLGFVYTNYDRDRRVRWASLAANYDGFYYPSAPLLTAAFYLGLKSDDVTIKSGKAITVGSRSIPTDENGRTFINFQNPGATFTSFTALEVIREQVAPARLKDKLVIIGLSAGLANETFTTPVNQRMTRSEIYANIIENIIHNNYINWIDMSSGVTLLILVGVGLFCSFVLPRVSLLYRMVILTVCLFILVNLSFILFNSYHTLIRPLFLGLELILFMVASPMIDESQVTHRFNFNFLSFLTKPVERSGKNKSPRAARVPTRRIAEPPAEKNPELQSTDVMDYVSDSDPTRSPESAASVEQIEATSATPPPPPENARPAAQRPAALSAQSLGDSDKLSHLGRYQVIDILGKGAMGTVFRGVDPAINRAVALKTIRLDFVSDQAEMAELRDRLFREAQAAGKLSHPNIVTIYDVGTEGNLQYIAMEYLEGQTLEQMIKKQVHISYKIIATIVSQICQALEYAHDQGIVHRDIKPANIMVLPDYSIKVMDFGIARVDSSSMTRTGIAMGTPNYISPELLQGKLADRRCDIFSLGVVFYELLTGRRPFKGENLTALIYSIVNDDPPPPSSINDKVPLLFDHVTIKALKKNPLERYQKASELRQAIADFVESFGGTPKKVAF
ncbi:MAG: serine/threonine-protein kinase [candidate division Zixibacteria bacterium]|nr:serine/threonine-protein kinase [candidate division Zixibacteria bacterium]